MADYTEQDIEFMREALAEARLAASEGEVPIGAVIVCGGKVIARGHNRTVTRQPMPKFLRFAAPHRFSPRGGSRIRPSM